MFIFGLGLRFEFVFSGGASVFGDAHLSSLSLSYSEEEYRERCSGFFGCETETVSETTDLEGGGGFSLTVGGSYAVGKADLVAKAGLAQLGDWSWSSYSGGVRFRF